VPVVVEALGCTVLLLQRVDEVRHRDRCVIGERHPSHDLAHDLRRSVRHGEFDRDRLGTPVRGAGMRDQPSRLRRQFLTGGYYVGVEDDG
jgi:hypothetical protein